MRKGYSLIELVVAIALIVIVGFAALPVLRGRRESVALQTARTGALALFREAQARAIAGSEGVGWSVVVTRSPLPVSFALVSGTSTTAIVTKLVAGTGVRIATTSMSGASSTIYFAPVTGMPTPTTTLVLERDDGSASGTISVSASGAVQ